MADYIDLQYAMMLSSRLERFKVKSMSPYKANFRCNLCGDSQKSKTKTRGWITEFPKTGRLHFNCFNCGSSEPLGKYIKITDPNLYNDYVAEKYINKEKLEPVSAPINQKAKTEPPKFNKATLSKIKKISQLKHDHPVRVYVDKRQIPTNQHYRLYYAPKFMAWINQIVPDKFASVERDEPRLVMPLINKSGDVFGVSARGFNPNGLRYITILFDDQPKIFGLDKVNFNETYYITEGAIDSLFLSNSVAMVGADTNMSGLDNTSNAIFVHDAEPRNAEICRRMENLLKGGYRVCIWPSDVPAKDINDMHLNGMSNIEATIKSNAYSGLEGQLRFRAWKKC